MCVCLSLLFLFSPSPWWEVPAAGKVAGALEVIITSLPFRYICWGKYHSLPKDFFQPPGKSICFCFPYSCLSVCFVILTRKELKQNLMMAGSFLLFTFLFPFLFSGEREPTLWSLKILRLFEVPTSIKKKNPNNKPNKKVFLFLPILTYSVSVFNAYN